jgi:hypothetical protein
MLLAGILAAEGGEVLVLGADPTQALSCDVSGPSPLLEPAMPQPKTFPCCVT